MHEIYVQVIQALLLVCASLMGVIWFWIRRYIKRHDLMENELKNKVSKADFQEIIRVYNGKLDHITTRVDQIYTQLGKMHR